ncbi:acetyltransferase [Anopheles sinensis]|uniref:Acetyltransferase n=1 Tax=Anopheles sinensis TaxID=74873 RepID=A0A084VU41_ANOSI|nr:acetyltransferase [Anopheles sinensis]
MEKHTTNCQVLLDISTFSVPLQATISVAIRYVAPRLSPHKRSMGVEHRQVLRRGHCWDGTSQILVRFAKLDTGWKVVFDTIPTVCSQFLEESETRIGWFSVRFSFPSSCNAGPCPLEFHSHCGSKAFGNIRNVIIDTQGW